MRSGEGASWGEMEMNATDAAKYLRDMAYGHELGLATTEELIEAVGKAEAAGFTLEQRQRIQETARNAAQRNGR